MSGAGDGFGALDRWEIVRYVGLGLLLGLAGDVTDEFSIFGFVQFGLLIVALAIGFVPTRHGLILLLAITIACRDLVQTSSESLELGRVTIASPWQAQVGLIRPSWLVMVGMLLLLLRNPIYIGDRTVNRAIVWFASVPLLTGLVYGGLTGPHATIQVPVDLKLPAFLMASILLYRSYLRRNPTLVATLVAVIVGCSVARHLLDLAYWGLDIGSMLAGVNRVSVDSTKGTVVLLLIAGVFLIVTRRAVVLGAIVGVTSSILLAVYVTRMLWLTALLGIIVVLLAQRTNRRVLVIPVAAAVLFVAIQLIETLNPDSMRLLEYRSNTLLGDPASLESVDFVRYAEMVDSTATNARRFAVLWGSGYGGYYTDDWIPIPPYVPDSFPQYSLETGLFYRCHGYVTHTLFKYGVVGLAVISALWVTPAWGCFQRLRRGRSELPDGIAVCMIAFMITAMLQMSWTAKGYVLNGALIAICLSLYQSVAVEASRSRSPAVMPAVARVDAVT
ncbi:MAG TPA: hypothetical protein VD788_15135 [Candidatus Polarisedimenticolaceae bacterium]|nr:hypothetical protein [Candidatus Polarisedimenticolaceae bacterium]